MESGLSFFRVEADISIITVCLVFHQLNSDTDIRNRLKTQFSVWMQEETKQPQLLNLQTSKKEETDLSRCMPASKLKSKKLVKDTAIIVLTN